MFIYSKGADASPVFERSAPVRSDATAQLPCRRFNKASSFATSWNWALFVRGCKQRTKYTDSWRSAQGSDLFKKGTEHLHAKHLPICGTVNAMPHLTACLCQLAIIVTPCQAKWSLLKSAWSYHLVSGFHIHTCKCAPPVPTALRVNGPTDGLGVDGRPPLLSPSQASLGPQVQGYRTGNLAVSPGKSVTSRSHYFNFLSFLFCFCCCHWTLRFLGLAVSSALTCNGPPKKRHRSWQPNAFVPVPPTAVPVPAIRPIVCSPGQSCKQI